MTQDVTYLYDTQDRHILGFNPMILENQPTRFRVATQEEIDAHFKRHAKSATTEAESPKEESPPEVSAEMQAALDRKQAIADAARERMRKVNEARLAKQAAEKAAKETE